MKMPQIGDAVVVNHRSTQNKAGDSRIIPGDPVVKRITAVYSPSRVKVNSGDTFRIAPNRMEGKKWQGPDYMTVR